jgi:hypothetical protein
VGPIPHQRLAGELGRVGLGQGGPHPMLEKGHAGLVAQARARDGSRRGGHGAGLRLRQPRRGRGKQAI